MASLPTPFQPVPVQHTLTSLGGVRAAGVACGIKPGGKLDLALLVADRPIACAGLFTQNSMAAAPVVLSRQHLQANQGWIRAIVVNSGNANACTGPQGLLDAQEMCRRVAEALHCSTEEVLVCSTGVIGHPLPMDNVRRGIHQAVEALSSAPEAGRAFLQAIMTTDAFPKEASVQAKHGASQVTVAGVCKGAGMMEPNMATLLAFVGTDASLSPERLRAELPTLAAQSFNAVHVDTHASTNDTLLLFATGNVDAIPHSVTLHSQLCTVTRRLAWLIARDGEGATKVTTLHLRGAHSDEAARNILRRVAASPLVRTALYGCDPNWGRIVCQVGNCPEVHAPTSLRCTLQGVTVFANGMPTPFDREALVAAMRQEDVRIDLELHDGDGTAELMTSDMSETYIAINAHYTS